MSVLHIPVEAVTPKFHDDKVLVTWKIDLLNPEVTDTISKFIIKRLRGGGSTSYVPVDIYPDESLWVMDWNVSKAGAYIYMVCGLDTNGEVIVQGESNSVNVIIEKK